MLTRIYVEALLVDPVLADQVWQLWADSEIDDQLAVLAWWLIAIDLIDYRDTARKPPTSMMTMEATNRSHESP